jgi:hypothetical protein
MFQINQITSKTYKKKFVQKVANSFFEKNPQKIV